MSGRVFYGAPGKPAERVLSGTTHVALGGLVQSTHGSVRLTTTAGTGPQSATASGGLFILGTSVSTYGVPAAQLLLHGGTGHICTQGTAPPDTVIRKVTIDAASGDWSTAGLYATALASGAASWTTAETCGGTTVSVNHGTVTVDDIRHGTTVQLSAGQTYATASASPAASAFLRLPAVALTGADEDTRLTAVSCATAGDCTAAGYAIDHHDDDHPLLATETSGVWAPATVPALPAGAAPDQGDGLALPGLSCTSPGNCVVVGSYTDATGSLQALALTESAGVWQPAAEISLPGDAATAASAQSADLDGVSCPSAGLCVAVGSYLDAAGDRHPIVITQTNGSWGVARGLTLPANAFGAVSRLSPGRMWAISCPDMLDCVAVGDYEDAGGVIEPMIDIETIGIWGRATELSLPSDGSTGPGGTGSGPPVAGLLGVSCPDVGDCLAAGFYTDTFGNQQAMTVTETHGAWRPAATFDLPNTAANHAQAMLSGVSCLSAGNCAVSGLHAVSGPPPAAEGAPPPADAPLIGGQAALLETERDGTWQTTGDVALPYGFAHQNLQTAVAAVSCASGGTAAPGTAGLCTGVGFYDDRDGGTAPMTATASLGEPRARTR